MPSDDITHPIPDLTGYITEGQIVLSRDLDRRGIYPPVNVLPSLSRLMKDGTGGKYTHPDHPALASQLYSAYARAVQTRVLASVVGEDGLADSDRRYLAFGHRVRAGPREPARRAPVRGEHGRRLAVAQGPSARRAHAAFRRADRAPPGERPDWATSPPAAA